MPWQYLDSAAGLHFLLKPILIQSRKKKQNLPEKSVVFNLREHYQKMIASTQESIINYDKFLLAIEHQHDPLFHGLRKTYQELKLALEQLKDYQQLAGLPAIENVPKTA